ncbi:unnamed protein product, partial [Diatraea saccharalis]
MIAIHASNFYLMEANRFRTLPQDLGIGKMPLILKLVFQNMKNLFLIFKLRRYGRRNYKEYGETLINQKVLEKYRYYVNSFIEVIQFLIVNELALQGNYILEEKKRKRI